jgi:hypothetical protein
MHALKKIETVKPFLASSEDVKALEVHRSERICPKPSPIKVFFVLFISLKSKPIAIIAEEAEIFGESLTFFKLFFFSFSFPSIQLSLVLIKVKFVLFVFDFKHLSKGKKEGE